MDSEQQEACQTLELSSLALYIRFETVMYDFNVLKTDAEFAREHCEKILNALDIIFPKRTT